MTTPDHGGMTREEWERTEVHKASTYSCSKCGQRFASPDDVYDHLDAEHPERRAESRECPRCGREMRKGLRFCTQRCETDTRLSARLSA